MGFPAIEGPAIPCCASVYSLQTNAGGLTSGTLSNFRFNTYSDLKAEGRLSTTAFGPLLTSSEIAFFAGGSGSGECRWAIAPRDAGIDTYYVDTIFGNGTSRLRPSPACQVDETLVGGRVVDFEGCPAGSPECLIVDVSTLAHVVTPHPSDAGVDLISPRWYGSIRNTLSSTRFNIRWQVSARCCRFTESDRVFP